MSERSKSSALWLGLVLVVSLAVNAFFLGHVVGGRATSEQWGPRIGSRLGLEHPGDPRGGMPPELDPRRLGRMLPESAREGARDILEARGPRIRNLFEQAAIARIAAYDLIKAEPFDRAALEDALARSRAADEAASAAVHDVVAEIISGLSPEERASLGDDLANRFPDMRGLDDPRRRFDRMRDHRPPPRERRP